MILSLLYSILELIKLIFSFKEGFRKESDRKLWIRLSEFDKYISIVVWMTSSKALKPYYKKFLARVEKIMKINSSTWAFAYFKEVLRLTIRALAGTPEIISPSNSIRVKRDRYGVPKVIPHQLRVVIWQFIDFTNQGGSLIPPLLKFQGLRDEDVLAYTRQAAQSPAFSQKAIIGILTLLSIFRVFKTKVEPDFSTITQPFNGFVRTIPGELVSRALQEMGLKDASLSIGKFKPFISANAGPNGKLSTWSAGIDALAFLHSPKTFYSLIRWMYQQKAYFYLGWFLVINIIFGPLYMGIYFINNSK